MTKELKYRFELKHKIMNIDALTMKSRISGIVKKDKNCEDGEYLIRSLYFDTPEDKALLDKINGLAIREKFRIRFYNHDTSFIRLEKKLKHNSMTAKLSAPLTKGEVNKIINNDIDFLRESSNSLLREFYIKLKCERLLPKSIVDYKREAFVFPLGNVRITIDSEIKTSINSCELFNPKLPMIEILENNMSVLEVKYDEFIPDFILDLAQINKCSSTAVSKYATSRQYM